MRATLIVAFCLCAIAGTVFAQTAPPSSSSGPAKKSQVKPGETAEKAPADKDAKGAFNWYADCVKLWEPATHMSRREWDRACRRAAALQKEIDDMGGLKRK